MRVTNHCLKIFNLRHFYIRQIRPSVNDLSLNGQPFKAKEKNEDFSTIDNLTGKLMSKAPAIIEMEVKALVAQNDLK